MTALLWIGVGLFWAASVLVAYQLGDSAGWSRARRSYWQEHRGNSDRKH